MKDVKSVMGNMIPCSSKSNSGQKKIKLGNHEFYADKKFIPLLKELYNVGLITYSHCAGHTKNDNKEYDSWIVLDMENITGFEMRTKRFGRTQLVVSWRRN